MAAQVEGLGTIPSIDVLKSELDSMIGTDYTIEETDEGWTVIANKTAFNIDKNGGTEETEYFDSEEWDKTAVPEDCFYWASDDPMSEDYGTILGYNEKISNYTILKFPSRCKIFGTGGTSEIPTETVSRNFNDITNDIQKIEIPYGVTNIDECSFNRCPNLEEIEIPNSVVYIRESAFEGCVGLQKVIIPSGVRFIGRNAFFGCEGLSKVFIPSTVSEISGCAFATRNDIQIYTNASDDLENWVNGWASKWHQFGYPYGKQPVHYGVSLEEFNNL